MKRRTFLAALLAALPAVRALARCTQAPEATFCIEAPSQSPVTIETWSDGRITGERNGKPLKVSVGETGWVLLEGDCNTAIRCRRPKPLTLQVDWFRICELKD